MCWTCLCFLLPLHSYLFPLPRPRANARSFWCQWVQLLLLNPGLLIYSPQPALLPFSSGPLKHTGLPNVPIFVSFLLNPLSLNSFPSSSFYVCDTESCFPPYSSYSSPTSLTTTPIPAHHTQTHIHPHTQWLEGNKSNHLTGTCQRSTHPA